MAELVVALDFPTAESALGLAGRVKDDASWVKVGLELFSVGGPGLVAGLQAMGHKVFLDLKYFDIPNTVQGAVRAAVRMGANLMDLHVLGGERMAAAALEGREQALAPGAPVPPILGVTVLTSMDAADLGGLGGGDPAELVAQLAGRAKAWGLDGVVCAGPEARGVKASCGPDFLCLTPGIRERSGGDDQRRTMTPAEAVEAGSDYLVVGRPITGADFPAQAAARIRRAMDAVQPSRR